MSSLKGLLAVLGITLFAGIGGLYALEELCERQARKDAEARKANDHRPSEHEDSSERTSKEQSENKETVDPYMVAMEDPEIVVSGDEPKDSKEESVKDEHDNLKHNVIFDYQDLSDEEDDEG